jgi:hypothetical protein
MIREDELDDLANSAHQECLMGGLSPDTFLRFGRTLIGKMTDPKLKARFERDAIDAAQGASNGIEPVPSVERDELLEIIRGYRFGIQGEEAAGWNDRVDAALK